MKIYLFLKIILSIAITVMVFSCATGLPTVNERSDVLSGKKSVVLLRITCELKDGIPVEAFPQFMDGDPVIIGKGGPILGGILIPIHTFGGSRPIRSFSPETRKRGWIFFYLEPGIHYLAFLGGQHPHFLYFPRYKVKIPKNFPIVYIGSLHLYCSSTHWGGKDCVGIDQKRIVILNDKNKAKKLVEEYLSDLGSLQIHLIEPF